MRVEAIHHLCACDAGTEDLPLIELRRHLELVKNAIIFFKVVRRHAFTMALFLSRAARAMPQVLENREFRKQTLAHILVSIYLKP